MFGKATVRERYDIFHNNVWKSLADTTTPSMSVRKKIEIYIHKSLLVRFGCLNVVSVLMRKRPL